MLSPFARFCIAFLDISWIVAGMPSAAHAQWPPQAFKRLEVLPKEIEPDSLVRLMGGFTRALGVRCTFCHVGEESKPLATYDFASDAKLQKRKARTMLRMVNQINGETLARLEERVHPPVRVTCATCHRGVSIPRTLEDVLLTASQGGGTDSVVRTYRSLRERYYGRATYDFGEVPLAEVATALRGEKRLADAERIAALNVEMNPGSAFAKRQHAAVALTLAFAEAGSGKGRPRYAELRKGYGDTIVGELLVNQVGYSLLEQHNAAAAIEVFQLNAEEHPQSANAYDSLAEAFVAAGDVAQAMRFYERSLELDPSNKNAADKLSRLRRKKG